MRVPGDICALGLSLIHISVADENGGKLQNRVVLFCDEFGTMPPFDALPLFSAGRSRRLTLVPIIQSLAQLEKLSLIHICRGDGAFQREAAQGRGLDAGCNSFANHCTHRTSVFHWLRRRGSQQPCLSLIHIYWGVAQRRKRIFLVADFAGRTADKILFIPEGMFGDPAPSF